MIQVAEASTNTSKKRVHIGRRYLWNKTQLLEVLIFNYAKDIWIGLYRKYNFQLQDIGIISSIKN